MRKCGIRRNRRRGGFTLLEILVVVAIIALLAAFVVPSFINTEASQRIKLAQSLVGHSGPIASAIDTFRLEVGRYPKELSELTQKPDDEEEAKKWNGPYLKDPNSLKDPWLSDIQYKAGDDGAVNESTYDLWSLGPDKQDGSDDDISNFKKD